MFCSVLPVAGNVETQKSCRWTLGFETGVNQQNFGGFDGGSVYMTESPLATNRAHLSQRGKRILARDLVELFEGALH